MKVSIDSIKVKNRFRSDLGDISDLADSIESVGLIHPIVLTNDNVLVAGARRLEACRSLGMGSVPVVKLDIKNAKMGEYHENAKRKDFTKREILAIHDALRPALEREAKKRQGSRTDLEDTTEPAPESTKGKPKGASAGSTKSKPKNTSKTIAGVAGVGHDTIEKLSAIAKKAEKNPKYAKLIDKMDQPESGVTVNSVYNKMKREDMMEAEARKAKNFAGSIPNNAKLFDKRFQDVDAKKIDLIFTDPPYDEKSIPVYSELGKYAAERLVDGGSLVCYAGNYALPDILPRITESGLVYRWTFAVIHSGGRSMYNKYKISVGYKPLVWFTKGEYAGDTIMSDIVESEPPKKEHHPWAQSTVESDMYIRALCPAGGLVVDPFMGSGTFGVSALRNGRRFIGCETNKEHYTMAKKNIAMAGKPE